MAQKRTPANPDEPAGGEDLTAVVQALTEVTQALNATASRMDRLMEAIQAGGGGGGGGGGGAVSDEGAPAAPAGVQVNTWEDDPFSEAVPTATPPTATPIAVPAPVNNHPDLQTRINGPAVAPGIYAPGTANFRYWTAAEAIARGINFWAPLLPPQTRWTTTDTPMGVTLVAGQDFNANYTRQVGLQFYQGTVHGVQLFSGESPDVVCHELGHAILDALRPQLFSAASIEVAAFHESFGDMSAILGALQLPSLRTTVLQETQGRLNVNSRLSRLAEQLGWGIRQLSPTAVDPDSLRNAANRFFYHPPATLPPRRRRRSSPRRRIPSRGSSPGRSSTPWRGCSPAPAPPVARTWRR